MADLEQYEYIEMEAPSKPDAITQQITVNCANGIIANTNTMFIFHDPQIIFFIHMWI
jgi:hypothetical protein